MKILVTGGAGFIASHLVDAYIQAGHEVFVLDNLVTGVRTHVNSKAHFLPLDIQAPELPEIIHKFRPEVINHHAAQIDVRKSVADPLFDARTNILGFLNILEAVKGTGFVKKVILASTGGAIYGDNDAMPTPETFPAWPVSPYGIAKLTSEHYLHFYREIHRLPFISLRYGNVYGPRQNPHGEAGVVAIFYQKAKDSQPFTINGDGSQTRDFVYVADVVRANLLATQADYTGIINIGTGIETSLKDLVEKMHHTLDFDPEISHGPAKTGEQRRSCLDITKAKKKLGWQPQVDLDTGLARTADFFLS